MTYRRDIDGLRAIAVLAVLIYHLDVPVFSGGFVGVDVFFVISGYLITRIIRDEFLATGTFSFSNFYIRRIRRLFPAMLATLAVSFGFAIWLFPPSAFTSFAGSLASALASGSNFWFWHEAGYFDAAARTKPLLHTWSLSVEEQFYLIWPAILVALLAWRKPRAALAVAALLGAASLALNIIVTNKPIFYPVHALRPLFDWFSDPRASIFYLLPFRVFEFLLGAGVLLIEPFRPRSKWLAGAIATAGLASLGYAVFRFNHETLFPSYAALLPCAGTAALIYVGRSSGLVRLYDNIACA